MCTKKQENGKATTNIANQREKKIYAMLFNYLNYGATFYV